MKRARSVALLAAGRLSRSFTGRLAGLQEHLGPVKGPSYRLASRLVNSIRAGFPVKDYRELGEFRLLLVSLPRAQLRSAIEELAASAIDWQGRSVALCDEVLDSGELNVLAARSAYTASLCPVEALGERCYAAEGDRAAVREIRMLVEGGRGRLLEIQRGSKALYLAGLAFAGSLMAPLAAASLECFRAAGLPPSSANALVESAASRSVRACLKAGRKGMAFPGGGWSPAAARGLIQALAGLGADLARLYESNLAFGMRLLGKPVCADAPQPGEGAADAQFTAAEPR